MEDHSKRDRVEGEKGKIAQLLRMPEMKKARKDKVRLRIAAQTPKDPEWDKPSISGLGNSVLVQKVENEKGPRIWKHVTKGHRLVRYVGLNKPAELKPNNDLEENETKDLKVQRVTVQSKSEKQRAHAKARIQRISKREKEGERIRKKQESQCDTGDSEGSVIAVKPSM